MEVGMFAVNLPHHRVELPASPRYRTTFRCTESACRSASPDRVAWTWPLTTQGGSAFNRHSRHHSSHDRYVPTVFQRYRHSLRSILTPGRVLSAFRTRAAIQPLRPEKSLRHAYLIKRGDQSVAQERILESIQTPNRPVGCHNQKQFPDPEDHRHNKSPFPRAWEWWMKFLEL